MDGANTKYSQVAHCIGISATSARKHGSIAKKADRPCINSQTVLVERSS